MQFDITVEPNVPPLFYQKPFGYAFGRREHLQDHLRRLSDLQIIKSACGQKVVHIDGNREMVAHGRFRRGVKYGLS